MISPRFLHVLFSLILLFFLSCRDRNREKALRDFMGTEVVFPASLAPDSTAVFSTDNKLIVWIDSTECSSCRLSQMYEWEDDPAMQYVKGLPGKFEVVFIFSPPKEDARSFMLNLKSYDVSFPVMLDENGAFARANPNIPSDRRLHAFLLDQENNVVMVGNPLGNEALWTLYKEKIRELVNAER